METINKNILDIDYGVIVHGVNCSGGFGSGLAGQIKSKYPVVERVFKATPPCPELLGEIQVVKVSDALFIVNAFTQVYYGRNNIRYADVGAIQTTLKTAIRFADKIGQDIHLPLIGCGLGGLDWGIDVKPIYETLRADAEDRGMLMFVYDWRG